MSNVRKILVTVIVVILSVGLLLGVKFVLARKNAGMTSKQNFSRARGNPESLVKIIEYMDYGCPACAVGSRALKKYLELYPDKIYLEFKYYPFKTAGTTFTAARYAQCAVAQGKFWAVHDALIERQDEWKSSSDPEGIFKMIANEAKLDPKKLDTCLKDTKVDDIILNDKLEAMSKMVSRTPTYFINGKMVVGVKSMKMEVSSLLGIDIPEVDNTPAPHLTLSPQMAPKVIFSGKN